MIFNFLKKKKLPKRLLVLSALPFDKTSFLSAYHSCTSDFVESLKKIYKVTDADSLWSQYQPYAQQMNRTFDLIRKYGGLVVTNFSLSDLNDISEYDIVIILAHHSDVSDEIEIGNKMTRTKEFIEQIPHGCNVILDITSCYSAHLIPWIKAKIPESKIIGINSPTSLKTRLDVITYIIIMMAERGIDNYIQVFKSAWNNVGISNANIVDNDIKLGSAFQSTLYAPTEACKGEDFIISVFLHKTNDCDEIEICARNIDSDLSKRNQLYLKTKLNKGDLIEFQVYFNENQYSGIEVDEHKKEIYWDNNIESVEFIFTVNKDFTKKFFISKIKLAVNKEPIGDMVCKINIVDDFTQNRVNPCCPISFEPYEKSKDMDEQRSQIINILQEKIKELKSEKHIDTSSDIEMCQKCIDLIQTKSKEKKHSPLRVFVSSTSDMHPFRKVLKEQIESCEMYADMYERWGQGNDYPRDMCCSHVLQSDIFVCILGAKYGFIEPIWNKSMTEIEYRVASNAGIPMLIYIINNYKQKMQELEGHELIVSKRQEALIEELKNKRLVCLFTNELSLQLQSNTELITLKNRLL